MTKYTYKEFYGNRVTSSLQLECEFCGNPFSVIKRRVQSALRGNGRDKCNFCSKSCAAKARAKFIELHCYFCGSKYTKKLSEIKKSKSDKSFCSKSCAAQFRAHPNKRFEELIFSDYIFSFFEN